jgi:hypothetical protein
MFLIAISSSLLFAEQSSWVPVEVQHLYQAAQSGNTEGMENNLEWHRELDKKKPEHMLKEALKMAEIKNDASAAVTLTTRLKQEQMGSWERYFRGITLVATVTVIAAIIGVNVKLHAFKRRHLDDFRIDDLSSDGRLSRASSDASEYESARPFSKEQRKSYFATLGRTQQPNGFQTPSPLVPTIDPSRVRGQHAKTAADTSHSASQPEQTDLGVAEVGPKDYEKWSQFVSEPTESKRKV